MANKTMDLKKRSLSMQTFFNERVDGYDNAHAGLYAFGCTQITN